VFWICIFFNKYFGFLYLDLLILYQKAKGSKIINFFFFLKKLKFAQTQPKPSPKIKLKNGFKTIGYKH